MKHSITALALILILIAALAVPAQETAPAPVAAPAQTSSEDGPESAIPQAPRRPSYSFVIRMLLGDIGGSGFGGAVDKVRNVLEGLSDELPFTGYRPIDVAWLRTSSYSKAVVQGPDDRSFELALRLSPHAYENTDTVFISNFDLQEIIRADLAAGIAEHRDLVMSTSFGMTVGETIVVGTTPVAADQQSLVILLTAMKTSID